MSRIVLYTVMWLTSLQYGPRIWIRVTKYNIYINVIKTETAFLMHSYLLAHHTQNMQNV